MGAGLTAEGYAELVSISLDELAPPDGPPRRDGSPQAMAAGLDAARRDLAEELSTGGDLDGVRGLCLEIGSCLYDAGAPHPRWRHWVGLAALGLVLLDRPGEAAPYLAVAEQWESLDAVVAGPGPGGGPLPRQAVWALARGERLTADLVPAADQPWADLCDALPAGDRARVSRALRDLADFWIGEDEEWNTYVPRSYPSFEPEVCAAAAIARRHGFTVVDVPDDVPAFLEPGLAAGAPAGLPVVSKP